METKNQILQLLELKPNDRYTIAFMGEMGFCHSIQFTLESSRSGRFAQYEESVELIFKPKGKRSLRSLRFYGSKTFAVWQGWIEVNTDFFGPASSNGFVTTQTSRYLSCDERYLTDAIASSSATPIITKLSSI